MTGSCATYVKRNGWIALRVCTEIPAGVVSFYLCIRPSHTGHMGPSSSRSLFCRISSACVHRSCSVGELRTRRAGPSHRNVRICVSSASTPGGCTPETLSKSSPSQPRLCPCLFQSCTGCPCIFQSSTEIVRRFSSLARFCPCLFQSHQKSLRVCP